MNENQITITIQGRHGQGTVTVNERDFLAKSAVSRVLDIHEKARHITGGQPFTVLNQTNTAK